MAPRRSRRRSPSRVAELQAEVRELAAERDAVILAHNYQLPEVQDVADFVGDSLGALAQGGRGAEGGAIAFCGVHFMAETASILSPREDRADPRPGRRLLAGGLDHRRAARGVEGRAPRGRGRDVRQHHRRGQGADRLLLHLLQRGRRRPPHLRDPRRRTPRSCSAPTCSSAPTSSASSAGGCTCGTASATSTPASARRTSPRPAPRTRGAEFLIHPECGCIDQRDGVRRRRRHRPPRACTCSPPAACSSYAEQAEHRAAAGAVEGAGVERWVDGEGGAAMPDGDGAAGESGVGERPEVVVATEIGMLYPLRMAAPDVEFIPANAEASCRYMKMITLPKLRDALRDRSTRCACHRRWPSGRGCRSSGWSRSGNVADQQQFLRK